AALGIGSNPSSTAETVSGSLTDNASGGAGGYTYALVGSATGSHGTITIDPSGSWSYTLTSPVDGATLDNGVTTENNLESFTYQVTDADGNTTTSTITIDVIDDVPTARADTDSVVEGASTDGNVLSGTGTTSGLVDVLGADGAAPGGAVTGVATGTDTSAPVTGNLGGAGIAGTYGTLILGADGSYTYQSNANAVPPAGATDSFVYTITDGDGDTSTTTLTISLTDSGLAASNEDASVDEA
ncbi:Ig-like domain-containing protein, partial [Novosphingobium pentaromativorans]|uniref:Ig-like domain-containing protein n=1 Tax=Novosphingobium pentaromativorans TaxID=205844 RepID=UPI000587B4DC